MDELKILYFHQHFSTPAGSTGIRSYEMARKLIARGNEVTMVCGSYRGSNTGLTGPFVDGRRRGTVDQIDVIEFNLSYSNADGFIRRTWLFALFALRGIALALTEPYDVLFATTTPLTAGIPGIFARWLRNKPFVFEVRDLWPELPRAMGVIKNPVVLAAMSALEWMSYHSATRLIGLAPGIVDGIVKRGIPRQRIELIPNGCDLDLFSATAAPWRPAGVTASDLMAVYAGTHGIANGLNAVIDAAVELKRRGRNDIKIVLMGDGMLKPSLAARANKEGLENVIFHPPVPKASLTGLMAATDIGMQILANVPAFYFGTSPNKFFDYLAAGIPVLNNYPGWLAEMITQHRCGYVVPAGNPSAFADALEHAAAHRAELKEMGKQAQILAKTEFNRDSLSDRFAAWLVAANRR